MLGFDDKEQVILDHETSKGSWSSTGIVNHQFFRKIDVELGHNYRDPAAIIHEFVHQLNIEDPSSNLEDSTESVSRSLFTEAVSIYFETLMYRFMEEKGFSKTEIARAQYARVRDFSRACGYAVDDMILLRDYQIFGCIENSNFQKAKDYKIITFISENIYQSIATRYEDKVRKTELNGTSFQNKRDTDFFASVRYVLGTTLAYWAFSQDDPHMPWKMLQFNQDLAQDRDLGYAFSRFGFHPENLGKLVEGAEKEIVKCSNYLNYSNEMKR